MNFGLRGNKLIAGIASNFAVKMITFALALVSTRMMIDTYGEDRYGVLLLSGLLLGYFSLVGMGIPSGVIKFVADCQGRGDRDGMTRVVSSAMGFYLGVGLVIAVSMGLFVWLGIGLFKIREADLETARRILLISGVWAIFAWPIQLYGQALMGLQEWVSFNKAAAVQALGASFSYVLVAWMEWAIEWALVGLILSQIVMWWMNRSQLRRAAPWIAVRYSAASWKTLREVTSYSVWLMVVALAGLLIFQTQSVLAGIFLSTAAIAAYTVASTPLNAIREINSRVLLTILPAVSEADGARDQKFIAGIVLRGSRINMAMIATLCAVGIGAAEVALGAWMGPDYRRYASVTQILLLGYCVSSGFSILGQTLVGTNNARLVALNACLGAAISILASLTLIDHLKLDGLAWGSTLPSLVLPVVMMRLFLGKLQLSAWEYLRDVLAPNLLSATIVALLSAYCSQLFLTQPYTGLIPTLLFLSVLTSLCGLIPFALVLKAADREFVLGPVRRLLGRESR
jgi:O-antigen/teichoic acid export membrane protein